MGKHVIFLGAGASYTSGYPVAAELRRILSSRTAFEEYVLEKLSGGGFTQARSALFEFAQQNEGTINFFREGRFSTVDEFSYLVSKSSDPKKLGMHVSVMKTLMTFILAAHNPYEPYKLNGQGVAKDGFQSSDYVEFIQQLFRNDDLHSLREDIAVLSFNYDPFFEHSLQQAYTRRKHVAGQALKNKDLSAIQSGFGHLNALSLEDTGFIHLKLHGTAVRASTARELSELSFRTVFDARAQRLNSVFMHSLVKAPIFFPWEAVREDGSSLKNDEFRFVAAAMGYDSQVTDDPLDLHSLSSLIWQRAEKEVSVATKISFVGLSFNQLLEPGLKRLFSTRIQDAKTSPPGKPAVVFANPLFEADESEYNRAKRFLCGVWPDFNPDLSPQQRTLRKTFSEFIRRDLK